MGASEDVTVDNRWVVPYCPVLSRALDCHVNVECCNHVMAIKYVCKYINKGTDQATGEIRDKDEITLYQPGRYLSSSEAVWRILKFDIHRHYPPVEALDVHLENGQRIYFNNENLMQRLENPPTTTLLSFFKLCQKDNFARTLLYCDVPSYFKIEEGKTFKKRSAKRGTPVEGFPTYFKHNTIGRLHAVSPNMQECFYLRLLLNHIRGPTSFDYLKTIDGVVHSTFQSACSALNLLDEDSHWDNTLDEAKDFHSANKVREIFAIIIVFGQPASPIELWNKYKLYMSEDFTHAHPTASPDYCTNCALVKLEANVKSIGGSSLSTYGLPTPLGILETPQFFDMAELESFVAENEPNLNEEQRTIYDLIINGINNGHGQTYFLDAPGGTGATFLLKLLISKVRSMGKILIASASSGIAATLLPGGQTAHSAFKIPLNINTEKPTCNLSRNCKDGKLIGECSLIIWDECTMAHKKSIEAVHRSLADLRQPDRSLDTADPMGGVMFLFSGDFRQTLPVVTRGSRGDQVDACFKRSIDLWPKVRQLHLKQNMRVLLSKNDFSAREFANICLNSGMAKYFPNWLNLCFRTPSVK